MTPCAAIACAGLKTTLLLFGAGLMIVTAAEAVNWCVLWNEARKGMGR